MLNTNTLKHVILVLTLLGAPIITETVWGASCSDQQEARVACNSAIAALIGAHILQKSKHQACGH